MPVVILEGPDGAGKTELGKELLEGPCRGWEFVHNGTYEGMGSRELFQFYAKQILSGRDTGVLIDRSFDSEGVYGPVMRGVNRLAGQGRKLLNRLCSAQGVVQVLCLPPLEIAFDAWKKKTDDYVQKKFQWDSIYHRFEDLLSDPRYVKYDWTWNEGRTRKDVARRFSSIIQMSNYDLPIDGVVGSKKARYLIVGEQVNTKKAWVDLPFFDVRGVSVFLAECFEGIVEEDLAFVNALDWKGKANPIHEIVIKLPSLKRVVLLGWRTVEAIKEKMNPKYRWKYVRHPNWAMRFNQKDRFKKELREALGL